jgi:hypothetical protein
MKVHYEFGDALKVERIAVQARDIDKVRYGKGTHDHKIQSTTLRGSAFCIIEAPLKAVLERRQ